MRRAWLGLAFLSVSWLFGLGCYHDPNWAAWVVVVAIGTSLLVGVGVRMPERRERVAVAAMLLPAMLLAPWPHRAAVVLLFVGLVVTAAPIPRDWPAKLGVAAIAAGVVLTMQALAMLFYESVTARSHELPWRMGQVVYGAARLLGIEAALDGSSLALASMRQVHPVGATWELLLDPVTFAFLFGGMALLCLWRSGRSLVPAILGLAICVVVWLPVRTGLLIAVYMHRALRTEYDSPLVLMSQFWNPWVHLLLLAGPVLLAVRFVAVSSAIASEGSRAGGPPASRRVAAVVTAFVGTLLLTMGMVWDASGPKKQGRVWIDEHRSTWERTDKPYDPNWYGQESGYNYACIYDYCSRFYDMGRLDSPIDANTLDDCDVLVVKVPTARYDPNEIAHIERFVEAGGGLLLIGEHTNVFNTGTYLNDISERFGFRFRHDCLFDIDTVFDQLYRRPSVPHPIVQHVGPMHFAVSCSIDPGLSNGRAAIAARGLRSLPADYHASNYYPQVTDRAEARYGAFVQLWTTHHGSGRVAAFGDSTIFSNFSTFEPGKAELMLGMLQWLNYRNPALDSRLVLVGLGVLLVGGAFVAGRGWTGGWLVLLGAGLLGVSAAGAATAGIHRAVMPAAQPVRPLTRVVIDRTVCETPLSKSGFIAGEANGFGIFERWILRLGYFTGRAEGDDAFDGDLLVLLYPSREIRPDFREHLVDYVTGGGKVLVIDSPANGESTANALLGPFGLKMDRQFPLSGPLETPEGWPGGVVVETASAVQGGDPLIRLAGRPVAATAYVGEGTVTAVGFGARFADLKMGVIGDVIPDAALRNVYELEFRLIRALVGEMEPSGTGRLNGPAETDSGASEN